MVCWNRPYSDHFKYFKDYLPQILLGPFLKILFSWIDHIISIFLKVAYTKFTILE